MTTPLLHLGAATTISSCGHHQNHHCPINLGPPKTDERSSLPLKQRKVAEDHVAPIVKLEKVVVATSEEDEDALVDLEIAEFNTKNNPHSGEIVAVAATAGRLIIRRNARSVCCFQLGMLDPTAPGFAYELRDGGGFGQLWGIMSRSTLMA